MDILEFLEKGNSETVILLGQDPKPSLLAKEISSLSNANGGHILLGVISSTFAPGIDPKIAKELIDSVKNLLSNPDIFTHENRSFRMGNICLIKVEKSESLILCEDGAYIRSNDKSIPLTKDQIKSKIDNTESAINKLIETISKQTDKIEIQSRNINTLQEKLNNANSFKSRAKDQIIGGVVGFIFALIGKSFGL